MAKYTGPSCRLCRREGGKLFLKGEKCFSDKCPVSIKAYAPGQHGQRRGRVSEYGTQLREKQKIRRIYGVLEGQFRRYFERASQTRGVTGELLLRFLELRLDNVAYRLGYGSSRAEARQVVRHGHITVNGRRVDIPSYQVRAGDVVAVAESARQHARILAAVEAAAARGFPEWLSVDSANLQATVKAVPVREDMAPDLNEQVVVELYSK
ncbi:MULTISPECIES: 30S ribosomal protein S4 [Acidithiobacillus]|uniref:Small ribosomal subunit protein uS4 n=1 Tax=Acidithiobacillus caldus TaxID=33059 RepID=A0A1E7YQU9_9PROT|nr:MULTISPECIES: 30S ribosomal protein S4 [Acidithiobacillus]AUW32035.1 30S ribosomal protein S4 [Acidithiobacillus caldus]MBU2730073.1 30S ribosomal protein S4 [Acidithiobacillus caldus]MBU2734813.1 30S ribosomal protein S4 [Acidithiobacillus caldus ATCC 51756]MBU2745243.1 30S ribosomal protein S4 [Acidithiobacillus caldus]MBU2764051.1 30S ribosomal protein S4 [Acidithiobacillus caldus]